MNEVFIHVWGTTESNERGAFGHQCQHDSAVTVLPEHCLLAESFSFIFLCSAVWLTFTDSPDSPTMWWTNVSPALLSLNCIQIQSLVNWKCGNFSSGPHMSWSRGWINSERYFCERVWIVTSESAGSSNTDVRESGRSHWRAGLVYK